MRFVANDAGHHVRPGFLQPIREIDVRFLVEARLEFDDDSDFLAFAGSFDERLYDG